ncbi:hypothetical protein G6F46_007799 [Rhizopus delemar]|uniref:Uncharacterized protein n=3 Tax=Rhizopus TaxID=4842 RepID=I1C998_RHIO9|nr:hypothetical protein RO3G_09738 [Rhizopus delemar RA 99-880]KAG1466422.1 hypothetical protein G6F55_000485 [Rhizopus delemar]KAG1541193.1 hypothetical protein G6F51_008047 [Rhizopus arrhizus]KAG1501499.1 hypothetical protein G6F54_002996 [Rhizopus delemar]KAG1517849.1 hypothetical protein G6F53_001039 [Rhizopus delemar]|eukprot:EIE85028.1 hypothetical protein RO3G_09738 [Rhizopus delemar RA 99-880]
MDSLKQKWFSYPGINNSFKKSISFSSNEQKSKVDKLSHRTQKSTSLYIKSFQNRVEEEKINTSYDPKEAIQFNGKEIRNSIRKSLSAVLYATPQAKEKESEYDNKLVPILVTQALSESVGGMLIDKRNKNIEKKRENPVEYDNTLDIFADTIQTNTITILWQGYCYTINMSKQDPVASDIFIQDKKELKCLMEDLEKRFERELWENYHGLIHPVHLFQEIDSSKQVIEHGKWSGLNVRELKRYYDNYGSMMLKIRESRMIEQQRCYLYFSDSNRSG